MPLCAVERADLLDTESTYTNDGAELLETLEPLRPVRLDDGTDTEARPHTVNTYDEGAPSTGGPYRLVTTSVVSAQTLDGVDRDPKTTAQGYDAISTGDTSGWTLRVPTTVTTNMGLDTAIVKTTRYDADGQILETRMPSEPNGGGAGSELYAYYKSLGTGPCIRPALAGMLCSVGPAAQPATGSPLPTSTFTYNIYAAPMSVAESFPGGVTRTTALTYDALGRELTKSVSGSPTSAVGAAMPAMTRDYDSATGLLHAVSNGTSSVTIGYDTLGRQISYGDADDAISTATYDVDGRPSSVSDGKGTTTLTYDSATEHRGLLTGLTSGVGANSVSLAGSYDSAGRLNSQTYPNGLVSTTTYDEGGSATSLSYDNAGTNWLAFAVGAHDIRGLIRSESSPGSQQDLAYDSAGRLASVADDVSVGDTMSCTTRIYSYSLNSGRSKLTSYPDAGTDPGGACSTATSPTSLTYSMNSADQLTSTTDGSGVAHNYVFDALGRATLVPSVDAGGGGDLAVSYFANDMVASETQSGQTINWSLDPSMRLHQWTDASGGSHVNHYAGATDQPAWTADPAGAWTRSIAGLDGELAAIQSSQGTTELQLTDLRGNVVATASAASSATGLDSYFESDEFGVPRDASSRPTYSWHGGAERSGNTLASLFLMGIRLYDPATGRFLQRDPIAGGSANDYDYANQDPVNKADCSGFSSVSGTRPLWKHTLAGPCAGTYMRYEKTVSISPANYAWYWGGWRYKTYHQNGIFIDYIFVENSWTKAEVWYGCINGRRIEEAWGEGGSEVKRYKNENWQCSLIGCFKYATLKSVWYRGWDFTTPPPTINE